MGKKYEIKKAFQFIQGKDEKRNATQVSAKSGAYGTKYSQAVRELENTEIEINK